MEFQHYCLREDNFWSKPLICWFHGSSFKGYSIVFPAPWLAKVKLSQKSNRMWFSDIFSRHFCSTVAKTIGVTNYAASFGAKKCSENHIWSCWDDSRSMEPTIMAKSWQQNRVLCVWRSCTQNVRTVQLNPITYGILRFRQLQGGGWPRYRKQG